MSYPNSTTDTPPPKRRKLNTKDEDAIRRVMQMGLLVMHPFLFFAVMMVLMLAVTGFSFLIMEPSALQECIKMVPL